VSLGQGGGGGCPRGLRQRGGGHSVDRAGIGACLSSRHLTSAVQ
jgi:hypothetical protein